MKELCEADFSKELARLDHLRNNLLMHAEFLSSPAERRFLWHWAQTSWPNHLTELCGSIVPQFPISQMHADFAFPQLRIAIEIDGLKYHANRKQVSIDAKRRRVMAREFWTVVTFTGVEVFHEPWECTYQLKEILAIHHARQDMRQKSYA